MKVAEFIAQINAHDQDSDALFELANLVPRDTGLPFVV